MTTPTFSEDQYQAFVQRAYQAFFSPPKYQSKNGASEILERGANYRLPFEGGELAVTTWGKSGPAVLLMHGWGGARAQMTGFVEPLLSAGYCVVAYDQPAHGDSDGRLTNLLEIAPTMDLILNKEGRFAAIIAHSFGTLITSYALVRRNFPMPKRLVYFGAMNRLMDSLPRFQALAGLPDVILAGMQARIYAEFGRAVLEAINNDALASQIAVPSLMFHDTQDEVTPIEDSRAIAKTWKSAQLIETTGLGHRGALQSSEIHRQVLQAIIGSVPK
jgi:pimeloyl-ACP methyl ester carboxylesterase